MGLLDGIKKVGGGALKIATAPVKAGAKSVANAAGTGFSVTGNLLQGDVKGAYDAGKRGLKNEFSTTKGYFTDQISGVKDIASGTKSFVKGGWDLIGEPVKGAARIATAVPRTGLKAAGSSLETSGQVLSELGEGDFRGAWQAHKEGQAQTRGHLTDLPGELLQGGKEIFGKPVGFALEQGGRAYNGARNYVSNEIDQAQQDLRTMGNGIKGGVEWAYRGASDYVSNEVDEARQDLQTLGNGFQDGAQWAYRGTANYVSGQIDSYQRGAETLGRGVQDATSWTGERLESFGQDLQEAGEY